MNNKLTKTSDILEFLLNFEPTESHKIYFVIYDNGSMVKEKRFTDVSFHLESMMYKFTCDIDYRTINHEVYYIKPSHILRINIFDVDQIALYE